MSQISEERIIAAFYPNFARKMKTTESKNFRFVHYTGAQTALDIIRNNEVWLRNVSYMNDIKEVTHGLNLVDNAWNDDFSDRIKPVLGKVGHDVYGRVSTFFNGWKGSFRDQAYIFCVSEHNAGASEHEFGKLSMWRAYARDTGVALVLHKDAFLEGEFNASVAVSPVAYLDVGKFEEEIQTLVTSWDNNIDLLLQMGADEVVNHVFNSLKYACLCIKHPAFYEEREWRVIHTNQLTPSDALSTEVRIQGGIPQTIYKFPGKDENGTASDILNIADLIDRIIIGPMRESDDVKKLFVAELTKLGIADASNKVIVSDIPLR